MIIRFHGAARTVTGSMHLVETGGKRILLDCGLFQGKRDEANLRNREFPIEPKAIDAVILSHAHIDHSGNLPNLVKHGFQGPIYSTLATRDLCEIMLADSAHIQEQDNAYLNKRRKKHGEPPLEPLYTRQDSVNALKLFRGMPYARAFEPFPNIAVTFVDAGHILGSASITLTVAENGVKKTLGFTGDIGRWDMPIIRDPAHMGDVDVLISESTYGGKANDPPGRMEPQLAADVRRAVARGGKIIVPAFSVGRTQDVVFALRNLWKRGELPVFPVYVDSPLAVNATAVYRGHPECFDEETYAYVMDHQDPFGFNQLHYVRTAEESKRLNDLAGPCMIVAASGMCEAGRILHHLANTIEDARTMILIVGYQAHHTLGRKLVDMEREVNIFGEPYQRRAEVVVYNSFSAHADGNELLKYIGRFDAGRLEQIYLVHGELERAEKLQQGLVGLGFRNVRIPLRGETFTM